MVGANPKFRTYDRAGPIAPSGAALPIQAQALRHRAGFQHGRLLAILSALVPLSFVLLQCGQAPSAGTLAANVQAARGDSFDDRFPKPQFKDRFPTASESLVQLQPSDAPARRTARAAPAPYRVASLEPQVPYQRPAKEDQTMLVGLKSSAFPYLGNNPRTDQPFLNISNGGRRGHRSYSGRVLWQDETFNDNRVLMHVPENFDIRKPGVIVVFFHGNGATLERDVRNRQLVPQQISDSGVNAVLLAPQLAVDAADSSAGKFWQPGGLKRFLDEAAVNLARLTGNPGATDAFAGMPVVIVGYSGGFLPTAWSLEVGGITDRVRGVVLLDAVYGQLDKFAGWIEHNRSGFFVSSYTHYTARHDHELMSMLRDKGIAVSDNIDRPLRPGSVVFVETPEGVTHRDYVTSAWTRNPIQDVLTKMAAAEPPIRIAAGH
jgi:hypothetical protein